jgi:predicted metal-dependent phosphoesterase TrpH
LLDEWLKPIVSFIDGVKGSQQETVKKTEQEISQNFQQFSEDPKNEFFEDVREDMADIIEMAANRGRVLTLPQAYEQACKLHPEVSKIISQREAKKKGELNGEQLLRKRKAASSIKGNPEEEGGAKKNGEDLRGSILQAFDDLEQQ